MQNIDNYDFNNKRAIIRVDFNVPLDDNFSITDDTRIRATIPTIEKIISGGGSVILMSHRGRPKSKDDVKLSLKHIIKHISKLLNKEIQFADDCIGEQAVTKSKELKKGEILLLENLRFYVEEEKGNIEFSKKLANLADVYVNDAFGTAHRAHASTTIIAQFFPNDKMFGYVIENELNNIDNMLLKAKKPFTAIMGGAKVSSKITIIKRLLPKIDNLIIGGGMTYTFIKAKGGKIGSSMVEDDKLDMAVEIMKLAEENNVSLYLPIDSLNADNFSNDANTNQTDIDKIENGWMGLDIGQKSIDKFTEIIKNSQTILWNGPVGVFEMGKFENGTKQMAIAIAEVTSTGSFSLIGGGDSVAAINKYNLAEKVSYVSTGGGALLEYMEGIELPGIKAIRDK
ncbi:MAG: phosphoglycerate kinase [Bacteroidales bacterium]|nr:phosphoglycerate kinase [Bacteroidales bacterium]MBN2756531.1 phosphoglycerate kinase [Bacteroidales bacterium]